MRQVICVAAGAAFAFVGLPAARADEIAGSVRVIDANRLMVGSARVRLFGIDAPDAQQACIAADGQEWSCGLHAARAMHKLARQPGLRCDKRGDARGEVLASCRIGDVDVARDLVRQGLAIALPFASRDYVADEQAARAEHRGLWSGSFETPAAWRRRHAAR